MVNIYENILSESLYNETFDYVKSLFKNKGLQFTTSFFHWEESLIANSPPILRYDFDTSDNIIAKKIQKEIENKFPYFIATFTLHIWPNSSYITWHNDPHCHAALTIYLNEKWDKNWGGYFMHEDIDGIKAIKPERNLGVLQENNIEHSVTTINSGADLRISLQFFLTNKKKML
jgi:hypothetical protein